MDYLDKGEVLTNTDLWTIFERNRPFVYIEKVLDLWVQFMKNGGKNTLLFSVYKIWVSLSEMSEKNVDLFHDILIFTCTRSHSLYRAQQSSAPVHAHTHTQTYAHFPPSSGMLNPWQFSSNTWKLIFSVVTWLHRNFFKNKIPSLSFLNFALFPLTSPCLASIFSKQCLEICITSTSCVCLPLYNVSLIVFLNCKSLWIKASAKWINVNVYTQKFKGILGNQSK